MKQRDFHKLRVGTKFRFKESTSPEFLNENYCVQISPCEFNGEMKIIFIYKHFFRFITLRPILDGNCYPTIDAPLFQSFNKKWVKHIKLTNQ